MSVEITTSFFVLAGRLDEAQFLARNLCIERHRLVFVEERFDVRNLRGRNLEGQTLWLYGTWRDRKDWNFVTVFARARGMKVIEIDDNGKHLLRLH